jgi:hypothetical protein
MKNILPLPPGNFGLPLIGETIKFLSDPNFVDKRRQQHGLIFKTHLIGRIQSVTRLLLMLQNLKAFKEISFEESDLLKSIQQLPEPRTRWTKHSLIDIVTIAIMAVLSGADDWNAIQG